MTVTEWRVKNNFKNYDEKLIKHNLFFSCSKLPCVGHLLYYECVVKIRNRHTTKSAWEFHNSNH